MARWTARGSGLAVFVAGVVACRAQIADLGGPDPCAGDAGLPASCHYEGPYSDGSGYFGGVPLYCKDPDGAVLQATSTSDVAAAIVGVWAACGVDGPFPGSQAAGVQFDSDGKFLLLDVDNASGGFKTAHDPARSGTFTVVDASSTLGPGTFQVRFTAAAGGVSVVQLVVQGSPSRLRFFVPTATDFVPALTWAFQAGVCGPRFVPPVATCGSNEELLTRMQGRWVSCSRDGVGWGPMMQEAGPPQGQPAAVGLVVRGTQWSLLFQDRSGALVTASGASGSLQLGSDGKDGTMWTNGGITTINPWLPVVDACERTMSLSPAHVCYDSDGGWTAMGVGCPVDYASSDLLVRVP